MCLRQWAPGEPRQVPILLVQSRTEPVVCVCVCFRAQDTPFLSFFSEPVVISKAKRPLTLHPGLFVNMTTTPTFTTHTQRTHRLPFPHCPPVTAGRLLFPIHAARKQSKTLRLPPVILLPFNEKMQPPPYDAAIQSQPSKPPRSKFDAPSPPPPSLKQEIKLINNAAERRKYEDLADLYSIIKATEHLEAAFARDAVTQEDYTAACSKLISQFKSTEAAVLAAKTVADTRAFMSEYHMDCPRAVERLLRLGVPATVINPSSDDGRGEAIKVAETVQHFITAMDGVRLEQRAVDELQPMLTDIMTSLTRVPGLPADFVASKKLEDWLVTLNAMRAMDNITEEQARQLLFDLDQGYSSFHAWLKSSNK